MHTSIIKRVKHTGSGTEGWQHKTAAWSVCVSGGGGGGGVIKNGLLPELKTIM